MKNLRRWRGLKALIHDAVDATTLLVGEGHDSTARTVQRVLTAIPPLAGPALLAEQVRYVTTHGVLGTIRGVNRAVEWVTDVGLDLVEPDPSPDTPVRLRSDAKGTAPWVGDALLGAVNGVIGDHLSRKNNGLDLGFSLRYQDEALDGPIPNAQRVVVLVHGLATTEWSWSLEAGRFLGDPGANFGTLLYQDLGMVPVFARYNTGCHVAESGQRLAEHLERICGEDVTELILIGHSMGGLVSRRAVHYAAHQGFRWPSVLSRVACLGSPHQGAPLERLGHQLASIFHQVDLPGTRITAAVLHARSDGIQDLRYGDDAPLLEGVAYAFLAGALTEDPDHPLSVILGDLLVQVPSAEGPINRAASFPIQTARFGGVLHHELQVHPDVYAQIRRFCAGELDSPN